jgi:O-antigen ligase
MAAWLATAAWTALGVIVWTMFPMTATVLLPACMVAPLAWSWVQRGRLTYYRPTLATAALGLAGVYLLINASWSLSPVDAARAVVLVFLMVATLHAVSNTLPDLARPALAAMAAGTLAGVAAAGALLCFEVLTDQLLRRLLIHLVPALQPPPQHVAMAAGHLAGLAPYLPNPNVSVLTLMFWPAALMTSRLGLLRQRTHLALAFLVSAVVVATIFASEHATSQVAFVGAGVTFLLFRLRPKLAMPLIVAGWVAANLLVVPVVSGLYNAGAYRARWLPYSAQHRVVIWGYTSGLIAKAPVFGAGISTGRAIQEAIDPVAPVVPGTHFHLEPGVHSHNAYLQVWYETGAVGAAILLAFGLIVLRSLSRFPAHVQPYLAATFAACALSVATAFAIWAPWFMATLAMASIFAGLGAALPETPAHCPARVP